MLPVDLNRTSTQARQVEIENMLKRRDEQAAATVMAERQAHEEMIQSLRKQVEEVRHLSPSEGFAKKLLTVLQPKDRLVYMQELDAREQAARKADQEALQRLHQQELEKERETLKATLEAERKKQEERLNVYMSELRRSGSLNNQPSGSTWGPSPSGMSAGQRGGYASPFGQQAPQQPQYRPHDPFEAQAPPDPYARRRQHMAEERFRQQQQQQHQQYAPRHYPPQSSSYSDDVFGVAPSHGRFEGSYAAPQGPPAYPPPSEESNIMCVTTKDVPGFEICKVMGPVRGSVRPEGGDPAHDRRKATREMVEDAKHLEANAVIAVTFDTYAPSGGPAVEVAVSGTAVVVRPLRDSRPQGKQRYRERMPHYSSDEDGSPLSEDDRMGGPPPGGAMFPPKPPAEDVFGTSFGGFAEDAATSTSQGRRGRKYTKSQVRVSIWLSHVLLS